MDKWSIENTTKETRKKHIDTMFHCRGGDCDNCGVCSIFKGKDPLLVFEDYIEGKKEFDEVYQPFRKR